MSFVRFVFLIPWATFVACVRMKHYTLRFTAPSPTWDSRQQLIVNLSKFKANINMIRTYKVFSILRHVINSPVDNIFGRAVCGRSYNPTFGYLLWWYCTISRSTRNGVLIVVNSA